MHKDIERILLSEEELDTIISRIAGELDRDYGGEDKRLVLLCILKGSVVFMGELMKKITVPVGYFKALLGYKKSGTLGITGTTGGYTAIGFYMKHQYYDDSEIMGQSMTIDDLEKKTGFDFFVNLPSKIGDSLAGKVESTRDPWWK